ncbi:hypothetical protein GQ602_006337 [Ophiocordyceps camponoti-floridani]|uniref:Uncharacterized protein n=1 Tax=Ophiocordyceps camponoti-floridani TaxID=2030778 RepID=A0A8H4VBM5_9HYPO|nr:hypothetical protein GQ602_006337 [Ophiocordyceps camponoti-floridani]
MRAISLVAALCLTSKSMGQALATGKAVDLANKAKAVVAEQGGDALPASQIHGKSPEQGVKMNGIDQDDDDVCDEDEVSEGSASTDQVPESKPTDKPSQVVAAAGTSSTSSAGQVSQPQVDGPPSSTPVHDASQVAPMSKPTGPASANGTLPKKPEGGDSQLNPANDEIKTTPNEGASGESPTKPQAQASKPKPVNEPTEPIPINDASRTGKDPQTTTSESTTPTNEIPSEKVPPSPKEDPSEENKPASSSCLRRAHVGPGKINFNDDLLTIGALTGSTCDEDCRAKAAEFTPQCRDAVDADKCAVVVDLLAAPDKELFEEAQVSPLAPGGRVAAVCIAALRKNADVTKLCCGQCAVGSTDVLHECDILGRNQKRPAGSA